MPVIPSTRSKGQICLLSPRGMGSLLPRGSAQRPRVERLPGPGVGGCVSTLPDVPGQCGYLCQAGHFHTHSREGGHLFVKGAGWHVRLLPWFWDSFLCPHIWILCVTFYTEPRGVSSADSSQSVSFSSSPVCGSGNCCSEGLESPAPDHVAWRCLVSSATRSTIHTE